MKQNLTILSAFTMALVAAPVSAAYVTVWSNSALNVNTSVTTADGKGTISRGSGIQYTSGANSFNSNNWTIGSEVLANEDHVDIAVNTTGFSGISLRFKAQRSGSGAADSNVYYSTNGSAGPFTLLSSFQAGNGVLASIVVDASAVTAINNNANVVFRLTGFNATANTGTLRFADISVTDAGGLPAATNVATIADALAQADGTEVRITGTVTVTAPTGFPSGQNQFAVQDASGADGQSAITVHDNANVAAQAVVPGNTITNLQGVLGSFNGLRQIVPTAALGTLGTGTVPTPLIVTASVASINSIESELITVNGADVDETGSWAANTNYALTAPAGLVVTQLRVGSGASAVIGGTIPTNSFSVTGIATENNGVGQVQPRSTADIVEGSSVNDWSVY